jgi:hypothetical protein
LGSAESLICLSGEFPVVPILVISYIPWTGYGRSGCFPFI